MNLALRFFLVLPILAPALAVAEAAAPALPAAIKAAARPVRVACVGDSITFGSRTRVPEVDSYPAQLQRMLDPAQWEIRNFGVSGATLLHDGDKPYRKQAAFGDALAFKPEIVIIMLGTNDSKPQNWAHHEHFAADYRELIAAFKNQAPAPRIFVCRPVPVVGDGNYHITEAGVAAELPIIDDVARAEHADTIDMRAAFTGHEALLKDNVHPDADGANLMARAAYRALTGVDFHGTLDPYLRSDWQGFPRLDFECGGRHALVVLPKSAAPGHPWIWRTEFFGVEPQGDLALLAHGWHVAYVDVRNLYGAPVALDAMDTFYAQATRAFDLAPKVVLEGFSRGGLFAFNWAARHPGRVACIYADAPVLDFKSWPGGRGKGAGSPADWARLLKAYDFTESQALAYPFNPIDNLQPLAAAGIPVLSVCGDADKTVPFEENSQLAAERYHALGGTMKVIVKHGGDHHPHSLPDPTPIVDFILAHAPTPAPSR